MRAGVICTSETAYSANMRRCSPFLASKVLRASATNRMRLREKLERTEHDRFINITILKVKLREVVAKSVFNSLLRQHCARRSGNQVLR